MKVWDALGGREVNSLQHADQDVLVTSCAFSPDAKRVVAGQSNCNITVYDTVYGTELASMKGHTRVVNAVVFSPDGKYVLSCSDDRSLKVIISLHPRLFFSSSPSLCFFFSFFLSAFVQTNTNYFSL